jgi:D-amino peptidase
MKIYILCDLEGTAGVVDFKTQTYDESRYNEQAKYLATLEINALIEGALTGGASEVLVMDGHGSGGICIEHIHYEAKVFYGGPIPAPWGLDSQDIVAQFLYGHHAMDNTPTGVLCHSWSSSNIANCWLNDQLIGEIGFNMGLAGEYGIPTVFVSGDRAAIEESRQYEPMIEGVVTKEGLSRTSALTLSPPKARDITREGAEKAMGLIGKLRPFKIGGPYTFITEYQSASNAASRASHPDAERISTHRIQITGESLTEIAQKR